MRSVFQQKRVNQARKQRVATRVMKDRLGGMGWDGWGVGFEGLAFQVSGLEFKEGGAGRGKLGVWRNG